MGIIQGKAPTATLMRAAAMKSLDVDPTEVVAAMKMAAVWMVMEAMRVVAAWAEIITAVLWLAIPSIMIGHTALKKWRVYVVAAAKLFVMPLLAMLVMLIFRPADTVYYTVIVAAASPVATTCTMMALRYDRNYHYASQLYVLTTLLSILTIPSVIALAEMLR